MGFLLRNLACPVSNGKELAKVSHMLLLLIYCMSLLIRVLQHSLGPVVHVQGSKASQDDHLFHGVIYHPIKGDLIFRGFCKYVHNYTYEL